MSKHEPHFACVGCADERTFPADHIRTHGGELRCDECWHDHDMDIDEGIEHHDLPAFVPEADRRIAQLETALKNIKHHVEVNRGRGNSARVYAATIWRMANDVLNKAEAIGK